MLRCFCLSPLAGYTSSLSSLLKAALLSCRLPFTESHHLNRPLTLLAWWTQSLKHIYVVTSPAQTATGLIIFPLSFCHFPLPHLFLQGSSVHRLIHTGLTERRPSRCHQAWSLHCAVPCFLPCLPGETEEKMAVIATHVVDGKWMLI